MSDEMALRLLELCGASGGLSFSTSSPSLDDATLNEPLIAS